MKYKKMLPILIVLILLGAGFAIWQTQTPDKKDTSQNPLIENNSNTSSPDTANDNSFIEQLRRKEYKKGEIKIEETIEKNDAYTGYLISYASEDLTIYGRMNVPNGRGPFPVIILNHGYYNTTSFRSGDGTQTMADILARDGYITVASDYRGHGRSESDGQRGGHRPEYSIDVLNLLASIESIEKADIERIGMWGHSMGGEVSMRAIEATDKVKAVALWAPTSADAADNHGFYGGGRQPQSAPDPETEGISPINYLHYITAAISIHQGLEDTEVRPEWSKELNDALKKEGKTVEYFEYQGQDHNFRNLGWDEVSDRTLKFYNKYLK